MPSPFLRRLMMASATLVCMCGCGSDAIVDETRVNDNPIRETSELAPAYSPVGTSDPPQSDSGALAVDQNSGSGSSSIELMEQDPKVSVTDKLQEETIAALDA